jgi:hypothetical protein
MLSASLRAASIAQLSFQVCPACLHRRCDLRSCSDHQREARLSGPNNRAAKSATIQNPICADRPPQRAMSSLPDRDRVERKLERPIRRPWCSRALALEGLSRIAIETRHRLLPYHRESIIILLMNETINRKLELPIFSMRICYGSWAPLKVLRRDIRPMQTFYRSLAGRCGTPNAAGG